MRLEYKSPEFKGNDNDGLYVGFCEGEPAVMFRVSKESGMPCRLAGWKSAEEGAFYLRFLQINSEENKDEIEDKTIDYIENLVFNMGYDSLRIIWPCEDERCISKYENIGFEIRGTVKNGTGRGMYMMEKCRNGEIHGIKRTNAFTGRERIFRNGESA